MTGPILVVKHGALGDLVLATGPLAAIRAHHPDVRLDLLTTAPFAAFMADCPDVDRVLVDPRAPFWRLDQRLALRRLLRAGGWSRVYDLQTSRRSSGYLALFARPRPEWSGIAPGASHPDLDPARETSHTIDRQRRQLNQAGIAHVPAPRLDWVRADLAGLAPDQPFALLAPGGSAHRPEKRWPADRFAALAGHLADKGLAPVLLGTDADRDATAAITRTEPRARDLTGRTTLAQIVALGRLARVAVGNDTGPMHLVAVAGAPVLTLFSATSDPALCAPRTARSAVLRVDRLADLTVERVAATPTLAGIL